MDAIKILVLIVFMPFKFITKYLNSHIKKLYKSSIDNSRLTNQNSFFYDVFRKKS